jgi:hypothetical protein
MISNTCFRQAPGSCAAEHPIALLLMSRLFRVNDQLSGEYSPRNMT